ncbi:MAG: hypothetical protein WB562_05570 [Candidatus Sulfotelmatobacter sp.]
MTVASSTIHSETITDHSGDWSSGPLAAGTFDTLILDINLTALTETATLMISRLDAFNNLTQMWSAATNGPVSESVDIGPCDAYAVSRAWAGNVQVDIVTEGTYSGTVSLLGRG